MVLLEEDPLTRSKQLVIRGLNQSAAQITRLSADETHPQTIQTLIVDYNHFDLKRRRAQRNPYHIDKACFVLGMNHRRQRPHYEILEREKCEAVNVFDWRKLAKII